MRIKELLSEGVFGNSESKLVDRFKELGIESAAQYFIDWMYHGAFKLSMDRLHRFEAAFYAINSVLSPSVKQTYGKLPTLYRAMAFPKSKLAQINRGGLPIQSRIMAWTPDLERAEDYLNYSPPYIGVVLKHQPKQQEVVLSMNPATEKFLHVGPFLVANPGETILSLPMLKITPEMVEKVIDKNQQ